MDAATLRSLTLRGGGYSTPRLNDALQAHGAGLSGFLAPRRRSGSETALADETAENETAEPQSPLAAYCCLKALNLADNGFESLEGMPVLGELRCLFIECNCLSSLSGLARAAPRLSTLDASGNRVREIEVGGRSECLPRTLETLRLSGNDLSSPGSLVGLFRRSEEGGQGEEEAERGKEEEESSSSSSSKSSSKSFSSTSRASSSLLPLLSTLDLSHCFISDVDTVLALLESLPALKAIYLQGNPFWEEAAPWESSSSSSSSSRASEKKTINDDDDDGNNSSNDNNDGAGDDGSEAGAAAGARAQAGVPPCRRLAVLAAAPLCTYLNDSPVFGDERAAADAFRESRGDPRAARAARERFCEAAALEAEKTTRLLERPPRFVRLVEEEEGDEEPDLSSDDDEEKNDDENDENDENKVEEEVGEKSLAATKKKRAAAVVGGAAAAAAPAAAEVAEVEGGEEEK